MHFRANFLDISNIWVDDFWWCCIIFVLSKTELLRTRLECVTFQLELVLINNGVKFSTSLRLFVGQPSNEIFQSPTEQRASSPLCHNISCVKLNRHGTLAISAMKIEFFYSQHVVYLRE